MGVWGYGRMGEETPPTPPTSHTPTRSQTTNLLPDLVLLLFSYSPSLLFSSTHSPRQAEGERGCEGEQVPVFSYQEPASLVGSGVEGKTPVGDVGMVKDVE